ncbi:MAG: prenyltransferase [Pseudomonadales bacterium]|nr:prenyltransferase [Pseudomonadales bacterium]NIX09845.1 prenyltransferase [Pseudomonadales bacterium]
MTRPESLHRTARYISSVQQPSGAIPWFADGIVDPWDHVEAAMGLSIGGHHGQAAAAFAWLARMQRSDGSWLAAYSGESVVDGTRAESNFVAYVATGTWHHYLISEDRAFLRSMWPTVKRALDFVAGLQAPTGEIYWAQDTRTGINKDALVTGCSSIYKSLECGVLMAMELDEDPGAWGECRTRLGDAIVLRPDRFDRTWESKARYSMDWFYPVLAGLYSQADARDRLDTRWDDFVAPSLGCRCVSDQAWVTVAESCELAIACVASGEPARAEEICDNLARFQAEDGSWWTGYAFEDDVLWPDERPTWTAGAMLLAADAMQGLTPASTLFTANALPDAPQHSERAGGFQRLEQAGG